MSKYYSLANIHKCKAQYNIIVGERANGKTIAVQRKVINDYIHARKHSMYVRKFETEVKGAIGRQVWVGFENLPTPDDFEGNYIQYISNYEFDKIVFHRQHFYLAKTVDGKKVLEENPFMYTMPLSLWESYKSVGYPPIWNIVFEEFNSRKTIPDEVNKFLNVVSTVVRDKSIASIYMIGNTISQHSPYFRQFGLKELRYMKPGDLDEYVFRDGDREMKVAVEFCEPKSANGGKDSDKYFLFDEIAKKSNIINAKWEMPDYPFLDHNINTDHVKRKFYIIYGDTVLEGFLVKEPNTAMFIFVREKEDSKIENYNDQYIYKMEPSIHKKHMIYLNFKYSKVSTAISKCFASQRVFVYDNITGEYLRQYMLDSRLYRLEDLK